MGRISDTASRTFEIADELVASGHKPTVVAIRAITQEGSFSTISAALAEWKKSRNWGVDKVSRAPALSEATPTKDSTGSSVSASPGPTTSSPPVPRVSMALEQRIADLAGMLESYVQQSARVALGMEATQKNLAQILPTLERTSHSLDAIRKEFREGFSKLTDHVHYSHAISQLHIEQAREQTQVYKEKFENASLEYGMKENLLLSQVHSLQQAVGGLTSALARVSGPTHIDTEVAAPIPPSEFSESENTPLWDKD